MRVGYIYNANFVGVVDRARSFATYGNASVVQGVLRRDELKFMYMQQWSTVLGGTVAQEPDLSLGGLGGWTLSAHHSYDPRNSVLIRGDGGRQSAFAIGPTLLPKAGTGDSGCSDGPVAAQYALFTQPESVAVGPDGTLYVADRGCDRISRVMPDGTYEYFALVNDPSDVALDVNGDLLVASYGLHLVYRITPAGGTTIIAGNYVAGFGGDGGPVAQAQLKFPNDVAVGPNGSVYIADTEMNRIREITPDGIIRTVAGTGNYGYGGDGGPATIAKLRRPNGVTVDVEGNIYIADTENHRIRLVRNGAGSVVKTLEYDNFGNLTSDSNPGFEFPFAFAGGLADATTGLVRFGFRDYDPAAGRWTAKAPVFFEGGQGNLYVYVGNNPISLRDPLGLWCVGGSFYATLGGGAQYCRDPEKGFSICIEAGVGVGGDVNVGEGTLPDADEIGFEFNPTCFGFGATLGCGFKICNGTATWQCGTEGEAGPSPGQVKHNGETGGVKFSIGAPQIERGKCKVQAKAFAKKCFVKRF